MCQGDELRKKKGCSTYIAALGIQIHSGLFQTRLCEFQTLGRVATMSWTTSFMKAITLLFPLFTLASCIAAPRTEFMGPNGKMVYAISCQTMAIARQRRANYVQVDTTLFRPPLEQVTRRQEPELATRPQQGCWSSVKHHRPEAPPFFSVLYLTRIRTESQIAPSRPSGHPRSGS